MRQVKDVVYREVGGQTLRLDLALPDSGRPAPVIVWIHGGGWMTGDRAWAGLTSQAERGYAVASIDYRLTLSDPFPACIEDCKHAVAFLRAHAGQYGLDPARVIAAGHSAGGHLAALLGVTAGHTGWEPAGADCSVQAVVDLSGPPLGKPEPWQGIPADPDGVLRHLTGVAPSSRPAQAILAAASPLTYITGGEPPFLIVHGDQDDTVDIRDARRLRDELERYGGTVVMHTVLGGGHLFDSPLADAVVGDFLDHYAGVEGRRPAR